MRKKNKLRECQTLLLLGADAAAATALLAGAAVAQQPYSFSLKLFQNNQRQLPTKLSLKAEAAGCCCCRRCRQRAPAHPHSAELSCHIRQRTLPVHECASCALLRNNNVTSSSTFAAHGWPSLAHAITSHLPCFPLPLLAAPPAHAPAPPAGASPAAAAPATACSRMYAAIGRWARCADMGKRSYKLAACAPLRLTQTKAAAGTIQGFCSDNGKHVCDWLPAQPRHPAL